jgi:hypothetical protein
MILSAPLKLGNLTVTELHPVYCDNPRGRHLACMLPPVTSKALVLLTGEAYVEEWTTAMAEARIQALIDDGTVAGLIAPQSPQA